MVSLYDRLRHSGLSQHVAWRAAFAIVPVPILLLTAALIITFGTDHPAGMWNQRHTLPATALAIAHGHEAVVDKDEHVDLAPMLSKDDDEKGQDTATVSVEAAAHKNCKQLLLNYLNITYTCIRRLLQSIPLKSMSQSTSTSPGRSQCSF
jgi:hypothetical protein